MGFHIAEEDTQVGKFQIPSHTSRFNYCLLKKNVCFHRHSRSLSLQQFAFFSPVCLGSLDVYPNFGTTEGPPFQVKTLCTMKRFAGRRQTLLEEDCLLTSAEASGLSAQGCLTRSQVDKWHDHCCQLFFALSRQSLWLLTVTALRLSGPGYHQQLTAIHLSVLHPTRSLTQTQFHQALPSNR